MFMIVLQSNPFSDSPFDVSQVIRLILVEGNYPPGDVANRCTLRVPNVVERVLVAFVFDWATINHCFMGHFDSFVQNVNIVRFFPMMALIV